MRKMTVTMLLLFLLSISLFAASGDNVVTGKLIFRVTTAFTSIATDPQTGYIVTEQAWFNSLSNTWEIDALRLLYPDETVDPYTRYYVSEFPDTLEVETVKADFADETDIRRPVRRLLVRNGQPLGSE